MKKNLFKRGMAGLLSLVMCLTALVGIGTTTAYAAGERAEVYLVSFPRSGDANIDYSGTWGHPNLRYMNGWHSGESKYTTIRAMHSYDGNICYCIEPGVQQDTGDTYTSKDETFWDNLPSDINSTISPYDMKLFIGRIMQYGYTGPISTSWRSQNPADAATLAEAMATQVLIWETVVGERDEDFDYVSPGSYDAVKGVISTAHPLYDLFCDYYDSIEASVQRHSAIPSFMSKNPNREQSVELEWDGSGYTATLTDHNRVLSDYSFSANEAGISFSVNGNQLIITATDAPSDSVRITANKVGLSRRGVITWTDGTFNQGSSKQDVITYAQSVSDPVQAFLNLKVSYGSAKIVKTSEDGKVDNLTFTVTGNGVNQTAKTNSKGEIQIDTLIKVAPPFAICIDKKKKHNLLICGSNESMANTVSNYYMISALLNRNATVYCIDGDKLVGDDGSAEFYDALGECSTQFKVAQDRADIIKFINEIYQNYQSWKKQNSDDVIFVVIKNLQFLDIVKSMFKGDVIDESEFIDEVSAEPEFNPADPFAAVNNMFANRGSDDNMSVGEKLIKMIEDGSGFGIHFVVTSLEYQSVRECMYYGENILTKFPERIIFSLGSNDADNLIENVSVAGLRDNTVYFTDGVKNTFQMKPYITPSANELKKLFD